MLLVLMLAIPTRWAKNEEQQQNFPTVTTAAPPVFLPFATRGSKDYFLAGGEKLASHRRREEEEVFFPFAAPLL